MSITTFIPELWSSRINESLKNALVFGSVVNTDYEGEILRAGDTVNIGSISAVSIGNYTGAEISAEELSGTSVALAIDQAKYFNFAVDDVDAAQSNVNLLAGGMVEASYGLSNAADEYIASLHASAGVTTNLGSTSTPLSANSDNAYSILLLAGQKLTENSVPLQGRWAVLPAWMVTKLVLAKLVVENQTNDAWQNGMIGRVAGFDCYVSNNCATVSGASKILCGNTKAISFAGQLLKIAAYEVEKGFKNGVKGLYVFGAKVTYPNALACISAVEIAES